MQFFASCPPGVADLTAENAASIEVELWRTEDGGSTFYRVYSQETGTFELEATAVDFACAGTAR